MVSLNGIHRKDSRQGHTAATSRDIEALHQIQQAEGLEGSFNRNIYTISEILLQSSKETI